MLFRAQDIKFTDLTVESIVSSTDELLYATQKALDDLVKPLDNRTTENTLKVYNDIWLLISNADGVLGVLENAHPNTQIRTAAEKASQKISTLISAINLNQNIYKAVKSVSVSADDQTTAWLKENILKDFERSGVDRPEKERAEIQETQIELHKIQQEFDRNIREDSRYVSITMDELAGLPEDYIRNHPPKADGTIEIGIDYADYRPFMTYSQSAEARRRLFFAFTNRAYPQNISTLKRMLEASQKLAHQLKYKNFAELTLESKMVKNSKTVHDFINELKPVAQQQAQEEYKMLLQRKKQDQPDAKFVFRYEASYYMEKVRNERVDFDSQSIRPFLPYPIVRDRLFKIIEELFDIIIRENLDANRWHEDVECYDLFENKKIIGRFYLDMHPRSGKYNHAAQFHLQYGAPKKQLPIPALICNFPGGREHSLADSLMTHDEVETFFHEFGHLLHFIFSGKQPWLEHSGSTAERDFVEVPSQFLEEMVWTPEILKKISYHYESGAALPDELISKLILSRKIFKGLHILRQLNLCQLSLELYEVAESVIDPIMASQKIERDFSLYPLETEEHFVASFGHLAGYTANYYTYLWSLAIVHDMLSHSKNTSFTKDALKRYRQQILEPGGSQSANKLLENFLGRPFSVEGFKKWLKEK